MLKKTILLDGFSDKNIDAIYKKFNMTISSKAINFIAIWGPSGAGKSFLSNIIKNNIINSSIFRVDDYLSPIINSGGFANDNKYIEGLDPDIWDLHLLNQNLRLIRARRQIMSPVFDNAKRERTGFEAIKLNEIVIIDGAYSIDNCIKKYINFIILIDATFHDRFIRKLLRTYWITKRTDMDESISRYINHTEPSYRAHYDKYTRIADVIISNKIEPINDFLMCGNILPEPNKRTNKTYILTPKKGYGSLLNCETLYLSLIDSRWQLTHTIQEKKTLEFFLNDTSKELLSIHYDFTARSPS